MARFKPQKALIIGASGGIGAALVSQLRADAIEVTSLSRRIDGFDVTDEASVAGFASNFNAEFDLICVATGGLMADQHPPEKRLAAMTSAAMADHFALNALGPALCLKYFSPKLPKSKPSCFGVLTAKIGSITDNKLGGWISYRAAKAAANQVVRTSAIELTRTRPMAALIALHPGTVATEMTKDYVKTNPARDPSVAAQDLISVMTRVTAKDTGKFFAYDGSQLPW
ncbi:MAG: SDR family NAD(P)-dependent oxidoreductase [Pseudomonadota bacterium]